jgi:hypothetical protein
MRLQLGASARRSQPRRHGARARWLLPAVLAAALGSHAGVLPDDRADVLLHRYQGGGITIQGPSFLVRKKIGDSLSVSGNYYVDMISSASIDVVTQASPMCKSACYTEQRKQESVSADYLHGKSTYSFGYIASVEPDYHAKTGFFSVSQDMFGDLTTVSFGFTRGWDKVGDRNHATGVVTWKGDDDRRNWQVGLSQVLTRNWLLGLNFETTENEGFLNNPYRSVRYLDPGSIRGYSYELERYPHTRTGNAASGDMKYYLPWHAALEGSYRYYTDTWGILAHTLRLGYTQPIRAWTLDGHVRYYRQRHADFYSDLFPYIDAQNFLARDRELAQFKSLTLGLTASWEFHPPRPAWLTKATLNFGLDRLRINYDDFRDVRVRAPVPGTEPLYTLDANIIQFFISGWF